ncbi:hypothetical protein K7432_016070 [Basidiobolus ranarum]|uniref:Uncharacterized protein n=1 Tax=Basidiobolus ranarum TaxID=34480 RepID=A0ABR2VN26_9FUNG
MQDLKDEDHVIIPDLLSTIIVEAYTFGRKHFLLRNHSELFVEYMQRLKKEFGEPTYGEIYISAQNQETINHLKEEVIFKRDKGYGPFFASYEAKLVLRGEVKELLQEEKEKIKQEGEELKRYLLAVFAMNKDCNIYQIVETSGHIFHRVILPKWSDYYRVSQEHRSIVHRLVSSLDWASNAAFKLIEKSKKYRSFYYE